MCQTMKLAIAWSLWLASLSSLVAAQDDVFRFRALGPTTNARAKLTDERKWQTRDSITLAGRALVAPARGDVEHIEIERVNHNGAGPGNVFVPLASFLDADQAALKTAMPPLKPEARQLGLLVPFAVQPEWGKAQPKIAKRYLRAVSVEPNHVVFRAGDELYMVAKSSFTPASYAKIAGQFNDHHSGRYVRLAGSLQQVAGKLLLATQTDFVFEAVDPPLIPGSVLRGRHRFRVPKHWMTAEHIADLEQLIKRFPVQDKIALPEPNQLLMMTCLRMLNGVLRYCEIDPDNPQSILVYDAVGKTHRESSEKLASVDYVAIERERAITSKPTIDNSLASQIAFQKATGTSRQRWWWQCNSGCLGFHGQILGSIGSIYVFKVPEGPQTFYVLRQQLSELDRKIAEETSSSQNPQWAKELDLVSLFSRRLLINNGRAIPVGLGNKSIVVDSAVQGSVPIVQHSADFELPWHELDYVNIAEIERSRAFVQANQAALKAEDLSKILPEIERAFAQPAKPHPPRNESLAGSASGNETTKNSTGPTTSAPDQFLAPLPKLDQWKLLNSSATFVGELVGEHEGDWVFVQRVGDENKYFVASPSILSAEARRKGEAALEKLKRESWDERLTRADNWQHFRVWHDPAGKVRTPFNPVVVLSISNSLIRFQDLAGSQSSNPMPMDDNQQQALVDFFQPAFEQGIEERTRAEESLTLWKFRDCEPRLRAALMGESDYDLLVKDAKNVQFLINKACLESESLANVQLNRKSGRPLQTISQAEAQTMPRVWCTRTKLVGPAKPLYLTFDDRLEIEHTDGRHDFLSLSTLTLREQLSFEAHWRKLHGPSPTASKSELATDAAGLLASLKEEIPEKDIVRSMPELRADIRAAIDKNLTQWKNLTWDSTPTKLDASAKLLAINEDARFGVVDEGARGWTIVELSSGKRKVIRAHAKSGKVNGVNVPTTASGLTQTCWMYRDARVYWIDEGKLHVSGSQTDDARVVAELPQPIVAGSQSTDYSSLVLQLSDSSTHRFDLATHQVRQLTPALDTRAHSSTIRSGTVSNGVVMESSADDNKLTVQSSIWASHDGTALVAYSGNMLQFRVPPSHADEGPRMSFLGTTKGVLHATCNRDAALVQTDENGLLSFLVASITSPAPRNLGMPFNPRWFGIIKWSSSPADTSTDADKELIQFIGKPADGFFAKSGYFFAHQVSLNTDYKKYAYQYIMGDLNEYLRVAANGAAIVHHRDGKYVISRRPDAIPVNLLTQLASNIEQLVEQRDIGQLEALGRYLEQPRFQNEGEHAGWLGIQYQTYVKYACFQYQSQLSGDRLERIFALADHLQRKYPDSQVAGNVLVDIHRGMAWAARGGGYVDTVTEAGIEAFRREMGIANDLVKKLLEAPQPMASTFHYAIDITMATTESLDRPRELAVRLLDSPHVTNPALHHVMALLLLPRWHGMPGMSEAYMQSVTTRVPKEVTNEIYAQQVTMLMPMLGHEKPITSQLQVDLEKIFKGTKQYYQHRTDGDLLDKVIMILAVEKKFEWVRELLQLRAEKRMIPSATAAANALSFRNIEQYFKK